MKQFLDNSYLFGGNAPVRRGAVREIPRQPGSRCRSEWREYFDKLQLLPRRRGEGRRARAGGRVLRAARQGGRARGAAPAARPRPQAGVGASSWSPNTASAAACWPTSTRSSASSGRTSRSSSRRYYDLTDADMDTVFNTGSLIGPEQATLREIIRRRCGRPTAARSASSTCTSPSRAREALDPGAPRADRARKPSFAADYKKHILERLTAAERLERYLHTRYVGQKRFSLEGGETLIPVLDNLLQRAGEAGVQELVIGMAHRGRLNVLVNTLGKMPKDLFARVRGQARRRAARRRRQVPPGLLVGHQHARRADAPHARLQPLAPGDRQPGGRGLGARAPAPAQGPRRRRRCCRC